MAIDIFARWKKTMESPADIAVAVTPDNDNDLEFTTRGLYIGVTGDVTVHMKGSTTPVTFVGMLGGVEHPERVDRVLATGTTATDILALG